MTAIGFPSFPFTSNDPVRAGSASPRRSVSFACPIVPRASTGAFFFRSQK
ncbi:MAG: hypothetical protein HYR98_01385 [Nitrospirae bacterium]|nr:hypothetical protein [Nitrospirota bacterium]